MKGTICRIIGKRGRTTIPFTYRRLLGITNDTLLKWQIDGRRIIVTPLKEFKDGICESGAFYELTRPEEVKRFVEEIPEDTLRLIQKAVSSKLNSSAEDKNIG